MTANPFASRVLCDDLRKYRPRKNAPTSTDTALRELEAHLSFAAEQRLPLGRGARVLDFGCGVGDGVFALLDLGYEAYGVDVLELWDKDFDLFWEDRSKPEGEFLKRLRVLDFKSYRIPFPDDYFDFCFSDQVMEHVFNYAEVFRELARVTKPTGFSVHRFPGPNTPMEGHIHVPLPSLCRYKWWLALWAALGRGPLDFNVVAMKTAHYPTKRTLRQIAAEASVVLSFHDRDGMRLHRIGGIARVLERASRFGLERATRVALTPVAQRYMKLQRNLE